MFSQIRTSKENKEVVSKLTRRLNLGAENVIARIAFAKSISTGDKLELKDIKNSSGKEYSRSVLFGDNLESYVGMICCHYNIYKTDKDISKYIKMHIDHGLEMIDRDLSKRPNIDGFDYVSELVAI